MSDAGERHDVVIVGSGIAGSALAFALARGGLDVLVLEQSETYPDRVRGEILLQWGAKEAVAIAGARQAGPLVTFLNNESGTETPFAEGGVLIGDAAGWTDPIIGCGLSSAYRDARIVSEILLGSSDWSPSAFADYAAERKERHRRIKFVSDVTTTLNTTFDQAGRDRRRRFFERAPADPQVGGLLVANLAGPEAMPAEFYTPAHRSYLLGPS